MSETSILNSLAELDFSAVSQQEKINFLKAAGVLLKNAALDKKLKLDEFLATMGIEFHDTTIRDSGFIDVYTSIFNIEEIISLAAMANTPMSVLVEASKSNPNMTVAQAFVESMKKGA